LCGVIRERNGVGAANAYTGSALAPGQRISGAEHPEYFSKTTAFHSILALLCVQPEDAPHLQRRARHVEMDSIGLSAVDAAQLEQIVEGFRVRELALDAENKQLRSLSAQDTTSLAAIRRKRGILIYEVAHQVGANLSDQGKQAIRNYMSTIISKSVIVGPTTPSNQTGGTK
jgi:hypothetical protein